MAEMGGLDATRAPLDAEAVPAVAVTAKAMKAGRGHCVKGAPGTICPYR